MFSENKRINITRMEFELIYDVRCKSKVLASFSNIHPQVYL